VNAVGIVLVITECQSSRNEIALSPILVGLPQDTDQLQPPAAPISHFYQRLKTTLSGRRIQPNEFVQSSPSERELESAPFRQPIQRGFNHAWTITDQAHHVLGGHPKPANEGQLKTGQRN
jgi:hypothetical protein